MKNKTFNFRSLRCSCRFVYVWTQFVVVFLTFNGHQNPRPGLTRLLHTPCWSFPLAQHWFLSQSPSDEQNPGWGLQNPPTQWSPSLQSYLLLHWRFLHLSTKAETLTRINLWITTLFLEKIYKAGRITKKLYQIIIKWFHLQTKTFFYSQKETDFCKGLGSVVLRPDNAILGINHYPTDKC